MLSTAKKKSAVATTIANTRAVTCKVSLLVGQVTRDASARTSRAIFNTLNAKTIQAPKLQDAG